MLAMIVIAVAALYFGRDIFVPLALAMLLSFALAPVVRWLRRLFLPNLPAVLVAVSVAFLAIFALGSLVAWQVADLAERLPTYRSNIEAKIELAARGASRRILLRARLRHASRPRAEDRAGGSQGGSAGARRQWIRRR